MRICLCVVLAALTLTAGAAEIRFNFSDTPEGGTPTNFQAVLAGEGAPAVWKIVTAEIPSLLAPLAGQAPDITRHGVLAQTSADLTDEHFPMFIYTGEKFRNFKFTTRFKIAGGINEQMAGIVFRYQNASNYYVIRANALDKNVRFYKVVNGQRSDPIGMPADTSLTAWHSLGVACEGNQINITYDGKPLMPALGDNSFAEGLIGFRTKSDTVAYFTDAAVEYTPVIPNAQMVVNGIYAKQSRLLGLRIYAARPDGVTRVIASIDPSEVGKEATEAEAGAIKDGTVFFGREKNAVVVTMPLNDRNGDSIAAVRVRLRTFWGETQDSAVTRARNLVKMIQSQIASAKDLD
jgi:hypothetical protein